MMMDFNSMGWWAPGMGIFFMVLWWGLIILAIFALLRWLQVLPGTGGHDADNNALELLKERYARGEIDHDQFEVIRRQISQ